MDELFFLDIFIFYSAHGTQQKDTISQTTLEFYMQYIQEQTSYSRFPGIHVRFDVCRWLHDYRKTTRNFTYLAFLQSRSDQTSISFISGRF